MPNRDITILVADDDPLVRNLTQRILQRAEYQVLSACSGPEALGIAANYKGGISLLITDVAMPGMDGLELADKMREVRPEIRILLMSGRDSNSIKAASKELPFMQKPFCLQSFLHAVEETLAERG